MNFSLRMPLSGIGSMRSWSRMISLSLYFLAYSATSFISWPKQYTTFFFGPRPGPTSEMIFEVMSDELCLDGAMIVVSLAIVTYLINGCFFSAIDGALIDLVLAGEVDFSYSKLFIFLSIIMAPSSRDFSVTFIDFWTDLTPMLWGGDVGSYFSDLIDVLL